MIKQFGIELIKKLGKNFHHEDQDFDLDLCSEKFHL